MNTRVMLSAAAAILAASVVGCQDKSRSGNGAGGEADLTSHQPNPPTHTDMVMPPDAAVGHASYGGNAPGAVDRSGTVNTVTPLPYTSNPPTGNTVSNGGAGSGSEASGSLGTSSRPPSATSGGAYTPTTYPSR